MITTNWSVYFEYLPVRLLLSRPTAWVEPAGLFYEYGVAHITRAPNNYNNNSNNIKPGYGYKKKTDTIIAFQHRA